MLPIYAHSAKTWMQKTRGLIGKKTIEPFYFETRWGIHTFGVKRPIDVVILNTHNSIVALKQNLKPNRIFLWNPKFKKVLELPSSSIKKIKLKKGNKIKILSYSVAVGAMP